MKTLEHNSSTTGATAGGNQDIRFYSDLMPSFLIRGTAVLSSWSNIAASSAGVLGLAVAVRSAKRLTVAGSVNTFAIASFSFFSTSGGILAGPNRPVIVL